jgi:hypothetical protein
MGVRVVSWLLVVCLVVPMLGTPQSAQAEDRPRHAAAHFGLGVTAVACTFVYGTAKVLYAVLGSATGGLAWVLTGGNGEVARGIVQPALRGDYVVRPANLTSDEPLTFVGRDPYRY